MVNNRLDLIGIGIGPFNLSLLALLESLNKLSMKFLDDKDSFKWHPELMFNDATMQTSYLKDLVTPIVPTNPYSFLNYLVSNGQFYHFLNTGRKSITRYEFETYCKWVSHEVSEYTDFNSKVLGIEYFDDKFKVVKEDGEYFSKNLCIASGPRPNIPACSLPFIGNNVFHAKSKAMMNLNVQGKKVLVVGGGQTGVETFRNLLNKKWGVPQKIDLITGRENLIPLDEGPFTNEVFTPDFVSNFHGLPQENKDSFTNKLVIASDGNTPEYLQELYNELYMDKFYTKCFPKYNISPMRWLDNIDNNSNTYNATIKNLLNDRVETIKADIIIMATGFTTRLPDFVDGIKNRISLDSRNRPVMNKDYSLEGNFSKNKIFMMNYSRHGHGIADPQTSLMSWRSAVIANELLGEKYFKHTEPQSSFINFFN